MRIPRFYYHAPGSMEELSQLFKDLKEDAKLLAGGTDLLVRMKERLITPTHLISLSNIKGMDEYAYDDKNGLVLGAGVNLSSLSQHPIVLEKYPALAKAASMVATHQIRNMATIGGNIFQNTRCLYYNRSFLWGKAVIPCFKRGGNICHVVENSKRCFAVYQGDLAPVIMALEGKAIMRSPDKIEESPLEDIFSGDGKVPFHNTSGSVLTRIRIPVSPYPAFAAYKKFRLRNGVDFPLAGVAIKISKDGDNIADIRICLTGVWSSPVVVREAKNLAMGNRLNPPLINRLAHAAYNAAHPLGNLEDSPAHRRSMIRLMVEEILNEAMR